VLSYIKASRFLGKVTSQDAFAQTDSTVCSSTRQTRLASHSTRPVGHYGRSPVPFFARPRSPLPVPVHVRAGPSAPTPTCVCALSACACVECHVPNLCAVALFRCHETFIVIFAFVLRHDVGVILFREVLSISKQNDRGSEYFEIERRGGQKLGGSFNFVTPSASNHPCGTLKLH